MIGSLVFASLSYDGFVMFLLVTLVTISWVVVFEQKLCVLKPLRARGQYFSRSDEKSAQSKLPATQAQKLRYAYY